MSAAVAGPPALCFTRVEGGALGLGTDPLEQEVLHRS